MPAVTDMSPRVLVVEDDAAIIELLRYNLESEGLRATIATSGEEAEVQVAEDRFDLIVLDWMLPGVSGIELCRRLRRHDERIDDMYNSLFRELLTYMMEDPRNIGLCTHLLFGAKNIERIGDHTTNIAENIYYLVHGRALIDDRPKSDDTSSTLIRKD